jgi:hypothetical protein
VASAYQCEENENRKQEIWRGGINVELNVNGGGENHERQRNGVVSMEAAYGESIEA